MTLAEIRRRVYLRMAEMSGATFTDAEIDAEVQAAYEFVQTQVNMANDEYFAKTALINSTELSVYTFPTDFIKLLSLDFTRDSGETWNPVIKVPRHQREIGNKYTSQLRNFGAFYYITGNSYTITPTLGVGVNNLRMDYIYYPAALTADANEPLIPAPYHELLLLGAVNSLRKTLKEPQIDVEEYVFRLNALIDTIEPRVKANPKQVRLVPGGVY